MVLIFCPIAAFEGRYEVELPGSGTDINRPLSSSILVVHSTSKFDYVDDLVFICVLGLLVKDFLLRDLHSFTFLLQFSSGLKRILVVSVFMWN